MSALRPLSACASVACDMARHKRTQATCATDTPAADAANSALTAGTEADARLQAVPATMAALVVVCAAGHRASIPVPVQGDIGAVPTYRGPAGIAAASGASPWRTLLCWEAWRKPHQLLQGCAAPRGRVVAHVPACTVALRCARLRRSWGQQSASASSAQPPRAPACCAPARAAPSPPTTPSLRHAPWAPPRWCWRCATCAVWR